MDNNNQPNPYATPASDVATPPLSSDTTKCPGFVKTGITLIMVIAVIRLIMGFFSFDTVVAMLRAQHTPFLDNPFVISMLHVATVIDGLVSVALYALFCWFVSKRKNWARIGLLILSILGIMSGLPGFIRVVSPSLGLGVWGSVLGSVMFCSVLCLFAPISNLWFRKT